LKIENLPAGRQVEKQINMSQDNMIKMECGECRRVNYFSRKNKKILKERLQLKKFCKHCEKHTPHKETK
jgi:large subunit ribosomal protein L33